MANRPVRIITKRTSVAGKVPTGTTGVELNLIQVGELATNLTDKKIFSYDGSNVFEFGSNSFLSLTGGTITGNTTIKGNLIVTGTTSLQSLSATTYISGSTNLYDIFSTKGSSITASTISNVDYIDFNTGATVTSQVGRLNWSDADEIGGLEVGMKGGNVVLQIGEENLARVYNDDTVTLTNGMVVYVSGNQGNTISVRRASATAETSSANTLGVVGESIPVGGRGYVNTFGLIRDLNTIAYSGGTPVYLGTTPGTFSSIKPSAPNHVCQIGFISRSNAITGSLFVHISNGWELDELHDVVATGLTNSDILQYNSSQQLWINTNSPTFNSMSAATLSGGTILSGATNLYNIFQAQTGVLKQKNGSVTGSTFSGNPKKATITFGTNFPNNNYAVTVTGEIDRTWTIESKTLSGFTINANANLQFNSSNVFWMAGQIGESN